MEVKIVAGRCGVRAYLNEGKRRGREEELMGCDRCALSMKGDND